MKLAFSILLTLIIASGQCQVTLNKTSFSLSDQTISNLPDGNLLIAGLTGKEIVLIKTDTELKTIWKYIVGPYDYTINETKINSENVEIILSNKESRIISLSDGSLIESKNGEEEELEEESNWADWSFDYSIRVLSKKLKKGLDYEVTGINFRNKKEEVFTFKLAPLDGNVIYNEIVGSHLLVIFNAEGKIVLEDLNMEDRKSVRLILAESQEDFVMIKSTSVEGANWAGYFYLGDKNSVENRNSFISVYDTESNENKIVKLENGENSKFNEARIFIEKDKLEFFSTGYSPRNQGVKISRTWAQGHISGIKADKFIVGHCNWKEENNLVLSKINEIKPQDNGFFHDPIILKNGNKLFFYEVVFDSVGSTAKVVHSKQNLSYFLADSEGDLFAFGKIQKNQSLFGEDLRGADNLSPYAKKSYSKSDINLPSATNAPEVVNSLNDTHYRYLEWTYRFIENNIYIICPNRENILATKINLESGLNKTLVFNASNFQNTLFNSRYAFLPDEMESEFIIIGLNPTGKWTLELVILGIR